MAINHFHGWGVPLPPFAENSGKIIDLIFEPFPKSLSLTIKTQVLFLIIDRLLHTNARIYARKKVVAISKFAGDFLKSILHFSPALCKVPLLSRVALRDCGAALPARSRATPRARFLVLII